MRFFKAFALFLCVSSLVSGCAYMKKMTKGKHAKSKKSQKGQSKGASQSKPADPQAQQRYYDMGMRYYSEEKYAEAKKAWQQAVQLGPHTPLGNKAQEYLKKTDQVLKTLQEMKR